MPAGGPVAVMSHDYISQLITDPTDSLYLILPSLQFGDEDPQLPGINIREQSPTMVYRSKVGWTFNDLTGTRNNKINFTEGGVARLATIATGNYPSGALAATAVQTAMNTAPGVTNTYTVTYSTATRKFTVARSAGAAAVNIQWITGANAYEGAAGSLGFTADDSGSTTYTGDIATRQSEHYIRVDLNTARSATYSAIAGHNLSASGTITLQISDDGTFATNNLSSAMLSAAESSLYRVLYFSQTRRFARLKISDVDNVSAYSEIGVWRYGVRTELTHLIGNAFSKRKVHLTVGTRALDGALHRDERPSFWAFDINWRILTDAQRLVLEALFDSTPAWKAFFFDFDINLREIWYVALTNEQGVQSIGLAWDASTPMEQVI